MAGPTQNTQGNFNSIRFPSHYDAESGHWMTYKRKKYKRTTLKDLSQLVEAEGAKTIALPLPPQLEKSYTAMWDTPDLGIYGNVSNDIAGAGLNAFRKAYNEGGSALDSATDAWSAMGTKENGVRGIKAAAMEAIADTNAFRFAGRSTGVARNPHKAVLFSSVNFRSFNFNYHLVATSYEESLVIGQIIKEFEIGMSPDFDTTFTENDIYTYPDVFTINFEKEKYLFKIAPCVLTDMTTDYHAEGSALYFSRGDERLPASIRLTLSFREVVVLSREDFKNGY